MLNLLPSRRIPYRPKNTADLEVDWWKRQISGSIFFLAKAVLRTVWEDKFHDLGIIHETICKFLDWRITPGRRKFLSVFRGSYKTTILLAYCVAQFIESCEKNIPISICYNTATRENAENFSDDFRQIITECSLLKQIYSWWPKTKADCRRFTKFKFRYMSFKFEVSSLETGQVSRHVTIYINDDIVIDDNAFSETEREKVKRKWRLQKSILTKSSKKQIGIEIDVGTPFHAQDLIGHIIKNVKGYDKLIIPYKITGQDGREYLTFPEVFSWQDFKEIREDQGASIFATQYELNVIEESDRLCQENWIKRYTTPPDDYVRYLIIDPAPSENKTNDPSAFVVVDVDEMERLYVVYAEQFWLGPVKMLDFGAKLADVYKTDENFIEKDKYIDTIADTVQHRAERMKFVFSLVDSKGRPKPKRIHKLKQYFETGRILFSPGMTNLENQALNYPDVDHDDILDALAYVLDVKAPPSRIFRREREEPRANDFSEEMAETLKRMNRIRGGTGAADAYF